MAFREMALTATILIVVSLSLTLAPTWSMAILILLGMIFHQVCKIINEQSDLPVSDSRRDASAHNDNASAGPAVANSAGAAAHSPPVFGPVIQTELSSTSLRSSGNYYEVFLSFRGPDIREAFADELYNKLRDAGIKVFKDDEGHGEEMKSELIDTITLSRVSIPIFSENYASSRWCLQELELMQKSTVSNRQIIFPIFYDVSPFDVRHQAGDFGRSFNLHEIDRVDSDTIETWRKSLQQVTGLRGAYLENTNAGHKSKLVRDLVKQVQQMLRADFRFLADGPSGIDFNVEELMRNVGVARSEGQAIKVQGGEKHPKDRQAALQIGYAEEPELQNVLEDDPLTNPVQDSSIN